MDHLIRNFLMVILFACYVSADDLKCDFDKSSCSFLSNDPENFENWKFGRGQLNSAGEGPSVDHTIGTDQGNYLYVNGSASKAKGVRLQTKILGVSVYCVSFFYNMYSAGNGRLTVYTHSLSQDYDEVYFIRSKTQGNRWEKAEFTLSTDFYKKTILIFEAKYEFSSEVGGIIALDDIHLAYHKCSNGHQSVCTFDESSCGYNALYTGPLAWKRKDQEKTGFLLSILPRVDHTLGTSSGGYWFVGVRGSDVSSLDTAVLESKTYTIRNREPLSCLKFYFYMDADGTAWFERKVDEAYLQVHIADHLSRTLLVTKAKNTTRHRIWSYVEVEVENRESFKITFTAGLKSSVEALIAIDDVRFDVGTCPETGSCDFEEDKCAWVDGEGDYTWVRKSGKSLLEDEIGPSSDKTLGTRDGYYVVISTEKEQPVKLANLESELFRATNNSLCLNFYYYSYGWDVGTLLVVRKDENGTESIVWRLQDSTTEYRWMKGTVSLNPRSSETRAVFRAILGSPGFFAIDDIRVRAGETHCHTSPSRADPAFTAWVNDRVFPNGGERKSEEDY
ncbi:MAM and LDL-receptor class A domain-containing protein 1-like isoform X2 [Stegodyphus dumicola]|uniref:MAM and LDL-receptor class A domain-containing protein 1-like isoform X2 n=1 Tax=Stegodyphus dumicola TaxID=202533 RepID=UPI0015B08D38|nr:MAM and LDL-receptor class A domain-containing protein 1-like isoform X2 [Stegodyphus dumicola]